MLFALNAVFGPAIFLRVMQRGHFGCLVRVRHFALAAADGREAKGSKQDECEEATHYESPQKGQAVFQTGAPAAPNQAAAGVQNEPALAPGMAYSVIDGLLPISSPGFIALV